MATSSASIEERWITPLSAATFLRLRLGSEIQLVERRFAWESDVTWTPQGADFRDNSGRNMHFRLGCSVPRQLGFRRRRGRFDDFRTASRGGAPRQRRDRPQRPTEPLAHPVMQQKSAAVQPLMRSATECIARIVSSDPRFGQPNADLGDLIVDSMPSCGVQVRIMIEAYDRYCGEGEGEAFFMGPISTCCRAR
jgi:hypothetical protein